jgi:hypothetical protein
MLGSQLGPHWKTLFGANVKAMREGGVVSLLDGVFRVSPICWADVEMRYLHKHPGSDPRPLFAPRHCSTSTLGVNLRSQSLLGLQYLLTWLLSSTLLYYLQS